MIEIAHGKLTYVGDHTLYEKESQFYKNFLENLAEKGEEETEVSEDIARKESSADKVFYNARRIIIINLLLISQE